VGKAGTHVAASTSGPRLPPGKRAYRLPSRTALFLSGRVEKQAEKSVIDLGQGAEVGERHAFVGFVHCPADQAELGNRAIRVNEPGVRGAAGGAEFGCAAGDPADRTLP
jgi:hypothetical protein